jgi:hypothetical protein
MPSNTVGVNRPAIDFFYSLCTLPTKSGVREEKRDLSHVQLQYPPELGLKIA